MSMPRMMALAGLLWLVSGAASSAMTPGPTDPIAARASIEECVRRVEPSVRGIDALGSHCPGIEAAIGTLGLNALLPEDWRRRLDARGLADLSTLAARLARQSASADSTASLDAGAARLRAIALDLKPAQSPPSWWDRLQSWVRRWLRPGDGAPGWLRFLPHWRTSAAMGRVLLGALIVLLVLGVVIVVAVELRAAGIGAAGRRRSRAHRGPVDLASAEARALGLADIDSASAGERPVLLLRLLVDALVRSRRLERERERDLTCRELADRARFDRPSQRADFTRVALLAERALYGPAAPPQPIPDELLSGARVLYSQLLAPPATMPRAT